MRTATILIGVNLLPLLLVAAGLWELRQVMLLYWLENGVIGAWHLVKLLTAQNTPLLVRPIEAVYFIVHYGLFFTVHGFFLLSMLGLKIGIGDPVSLFLALPRDIWPLVLLLVASHGYSTIWHYFIGGEYAAVKSGELFMRPYARVVVLHLTILGAGFLTQMYDEPRALLVVLVLLKTVIDVAMHLRSHAKPAMPAGRTPP
ncbi:MAG: DUF6498-containing protein [Burkholderiales bacterium]